MYNLYAFWLTWLITWLSRPFVLLRICTAFVTLVSSLSANQTGGDDGYVSCKQHDKENIYYYIKYWYLFKWKYLFLLFYNISSYSSFLFHLVQNSIWKVFFRIYQGKNEMNNVNNLIDRLYKITSINIQCGNFCLTNLETFSRQFKVYEYQCCQLTLSKKV